MRINLSSESAVAEESDELCGSAADAPAPCMFTRTHTHVHKYTHNQIGFACVAEHAPRYRSSYRVLQTKSLTKIQKLLTQRAHVNFNKGDGNGSEHVKPKTCCARTKNVISLLHIPPIFSLCVMTSYSIDHYTVSEVVFGHSREFVFVFSVDDYPSAVVETLCQFVKPYSFLSCRAGEQQRMTIKGSRVAKTHVGRWKRTDQKTTMMSRRKKLSTMTSV
jgi:hypothetical protein